LACKPELRIIPGDCRLAIAGVLLRIADVIPVEAINVVLPGNVRGHGEIPPCRVGMARVEVKAFGHEGGSRGILHQVFRMEVDHVIRVGWQSAVPPDHLGGHPTMDLDPGRPGVRLGDNVCQGVVTAGNRCCLRVIAREGRVKRISAPPHLDEDGVVVVGPGVRNELGCL